MSCETAVEPVARSQTQRSPVSMRMRWNTATSISCPIRNAMIEPAIVHMPCPKMLANAACMFGTPLLLVDRDPELRGRQRDRQVRREKSVADQHDGQPRNETHAAAAEVLVDDVGHQEDERPQQHAAGERQRAALPEQVPVERARVPSVGSSAKIFTPTNSAIIALQTRNAASTTNRRAARESSGPAAASFLFLEVTGDRASGTGRLAPPMIRITAINVYPVKGCRGIASGERTHRCDRLRARSRVADRAAGRPLHDPARRAAARADRDGPGRHAIGPRQTERHCGCGFPAATSWTCRSLRQRARSKSRAGRTAARRSTPARKRRNS